MLKRVIRKFFIIVLIASLFVFITQTLAKAKEQDGIQMISEQSEEQNGAKERTNDGNIENSGDNQTPTAEPTVAPTAEPTAEPTNQPTAVPTTEPTTAPTTQPTVEPTAKPTTQPTANPQDNQNQGSGSTGGQNSGSQNNQGSSGSTTGSGNGSSNSGSGNSSTSSVGSTQDKPASTIPTSTPKTKSNDANLRDLKVDAKGLTPEFDRNVTEYYLVVDLSVEKIKVTATKSNSKATVKITGNDKLKEGENTIKINVKAEDGTEKNYIIHVTKTKDKEKANANLKSLKIGNYDLSPNFRPNIYNYNLTINEAIESLEVTAEAEKKKAKFEIKGGKDLKEGENLIQINVTAEDGITVMKYKVRVYIDTQKVEVKEESKIPAIVLLVILTIGIVASSVILIKKHK